MIECYSIKEQYYYVIPIHTETFFFANFRFQRARPVDLQRFVIGNDLAEKHVAQDVNVVERQRGKSVRRSRQFRHCTNTFPRMYSVEIALQGM